MARVKRGVTSHKRHKRLLQAAEGRKGAKSRLIKPAREALLHALAYATRDRKQRKRQMRQLWIVRINAAVRQNDLTYRQFISGLKRADIQLGVSAAAQDADESRFALASPVQRFPPGDSRFNTDGMYAPYYTPASLSYQSLIGAVALHLSPEVTLRGGGGYAIRDFVKEFRMTYPIWHDPDERVQSTFLAIGVPASYLIDRQGVLRWRRIGVIRATDTTLTRALTDALAAR